MSSFKAAFKSRFSKDLPPPPPPKKEEEDYVISSPRFTSPTDTIPSVASPNEFHVLSSYNALPSFPEGSTTSQHSREVETSNLTAVRQPSSKLSVGLRKPKQSLYDPDQEKEENQQNNNRPVATITTSGTRGRTPAFVSQLISPLTAFSSLKKSSHASLPSPLRSRRSQKNNDKQSQPSSPSSQADPSFQTLSITSSPPADRGFFSPTSFYSQDLPAEQPLQQPQQLQQQQQSQNDAANHEKAVRRAKHTTLDAFYDAYHRDSPPPLPPKPSYFPTDIARESFAGDEVSIEDLVDSYQGSPVEPTTTSSLAMMTITPSPTTFVPVTSQNTGAPSLNHDKPTPVATENPRSTSDASAPPSHQKTYEDHNSLERPSFPQLPEPSHLREDENQSTDEKQKSLPSSSSLPQSKIGPTVPATTNVLPSLQPNQAVQPETTTTTTTTTTATTTTTTTHLSRHSNQPHLTNALETNPPTRQQQEHSKHKDLETPFVSSYSSSTVPSSHSASSTSTANSFSVNNLGYDFSYVDELFPTSKPPPRTSSKQNVQTTTESKLNDPQSSTAEIYDTVPGATHDNTATSNEQKFTNKDNLGSSERRNSSVSLESRKRSNSTERIDKAKEEDINELVERQRSALQSAAINTNTTTNTNTNSINISSFALSNYPHNILNASDESAATKDNNHIRINHSGSDSTSTLKVPSSVSSLPPRTSSRSLTARTRSLTRPDTANSVEKPSSISSGISYIAGPIDEFYHVVYDTPVSDQQTETNDYHLPSQPSSNSVREDDPSNPDSPSSRSSSTENRRSGFSLVQASATSSVSSTGEEYSEANMGQKGSKLKGSVLRRDRADGSSTTTSDSAPASSMMAPPSSISSAPSQISHHQVGGVKSGLPNTPHPPNQQRHQLPPLPQQQQQQQQQLQLPSERPPGANDATSKTPILSLPSSVRPQATAPSIPFPNRLPTPEYDRGEGKPMLVTVVSTVSPESSTGPSPEPSLAGKQWGSTTGAHVPTAPTDTTSTVGSRHSNTNPQNRSGSHDSQSTVTGRGSVPPPPPPHLTNPYPPRTTSTASSNSRHMSVDFPRGTKRDAPGTVYESPTIRPSHLQCFHHHRRMLRVSNRVYPLNCQVCRQAQGDDFFRCSWCFVRICFHCNQNLQRMRGDLPGLLASRTPNGPNTVNTAPPPSIPSTAGNSYHRPTPSDASQTLGPRRLVPYQNGPL